MLNQSIRVTKPNFLPIKHKCYAIASIAGIFTTISHSAAFAACVATGTTVDCIDGGLNPDTTATVRYLPPTTTDIVLHTGFDVATSGSGYAGIGVDIYAVSGNPNISINQNAGSTVTTSGNVAFGLRTVIVGTTANMSVTQSGTITTTGNVQSDGVEMDHEGSGTVTLHQTATGLVNISGAGVGLYARLTGAGTVAVTQDAGGIVNTTNNTGSTGIYAIGGSATSANLAGTINTSVLGAAVVVAGNEAGERSLVLQNTSKIVSLGEGVKVINAEYGPAVLATVEFDQKAGSTIDARGTGVYLGNETAGAITGNIAGRIRGGATTNSAALKTTDTFFNFTPTNSSTNLIFATTADVATLGTMAIENYGTHLTVDNSGKIIGDIISNYVGVATNDTLINRAGGIYSGNVKLGEGTDTVSLAAGSTTTGTIDMGLGSDTVTVATGANISGVTNFNGGDDLSTADGFVDTLTLQGQTMSSNGSRFFNWENLVLDNSSLKVLDNNIAVGSSPGTGLKLQNGAVLDATTGLTINGNLSNSSRVTLQDSNIGDQLVVNSDYIGGGMLALDVNTQSNLSDIVTITGNVSGSPTLVAVQNQGLSGTYTGTGVNKGIKLINVGGNAKSDAFALKNGPLVAGAFAYNLSQQADKSWYLQSVIDSTALGGMFATHQAEDVATTMLGTRHERVGDQPARPTQKGEFWARAVAKSSTETLSASGIGDVTVSSTMTGLQTGIDLLSHHYSDVTTTLGVYGAMVWANSNLHTADAGGALAQTSANGYVGGLYADLDTARGWYAEGVLQGDWLDMSGGSAAKSDLNTKAHTVLASLELGAPIELSANSAFEPQAQLIYSRTSAATATDTYGQANIFADQGTVIGRAGFRLKSNQKLSGGGQLSGWMKANIWAAFDPQGQAVTAGSTNTSISGKTKWADVGIGIDLKIAPQVAMFADGDVEFGLDQAYTAFTGKAGMKLEF